MGASLLPLLAQDPTLADLNDLKTALDQPVQVASKRTQRLKEAAADITVLRRQDLLDLGYRTLGEALGGVLGFRTNQDRAYTGLAVRGLYVLGDQNTRVLILLDGHALNSAAEVGSSKVGEDFGLSMDQVERIEIVRGPASSLYGNNSFLGMVNVVTRDLGAKGASGEAGVTVGSHGLAEMAGQVGGALGSVRWQAMLSGLGRQGTGTQFPELGPERLPANLDREDRRSAYLKLLGKDWSAAGYYLDRTQGLASAPFFSVPGAAANRYENRMLFGEGRYTPTLGGVEMLFRVFGDRNEFLSTFDYDGIRAPGVEGPYGESDPNWSLGGELQARVRAGSSLLVTLGHEQSWQHYGSNAGIAPDLVGTEVRHQVGNSYFQAEWTPADTLTVIAGLQNSSWNVGSARSLVGGTTIQYGSSTLQGVTPRLGLIWQPTSGDIFKVLYGGGYRNPTIFERYYTDLISFAVNPSLEAERITTLQGIWVRVWPTGLQSQISASRSGWQHIVQPVDLGGGLQQATNSPADLVGTSLEAELQGHWGGWSLYGQAGAYRWEQAGTSFSNATRFQGAFRLTRHQGPLTLSAELRQTGSRQGAPETPDAPQATVLRCAARWQCPGPVWPGLWVRATLEDAGQARRVDLVARDYAPITRMASDGRSFYLTLGVPF
jgi:iron complex outermembrane receptor protein